MPPVMGGILIGTFKFLPGDGSLPAPLAPHIGLTTIETTTIADAIPTGAPQATPGGKLLGVLFFTFEGNTITALNAVADPTRLAEMEITLLADSFERL
ncbi:MAG: hypothetical protein KGN79_10575 [Acidobacteriota bacterium]|nr:hypothetical protein [Acidobacteriota bacterium]